MEFSALIFGVVPPLLAIMLEKYPFVSESYLKDQSKAAFNEAVGEAAKNYSDAQKEEVIDTLRITSQGVLSVASLMPSVISVVVGALTVIYEFKDAFWAIFFLVIGVIVVGTLLYRAIAGKNPYRMAHSYVTYEAKDGSPVVLDTTYVDLVSKYIIRLNIFLIVLIIIVFFYANRCADSVLDQLPFLVATCP